MPSPTQDTRTILDELRESRREIAQEIDEERDRLRDLEARRYEMDEQIAHIEGDALGADYYRAEAAVRRADNPITRHAVFVAFVRMMAATHLRNGTMPGPGSYAQPIEEEMDRQRSGGVQ